MTRAGRRKQLVHDYPPGKFNWWAFLFGWFYYLYKGLIGLGCVWFVISIFVGFLFMWFVGIAIAVVMGFTFNEAYLKKEGIVVKKD